MAEITFAEPDVSVLHALDCACFTDPWSSSRWRAFARAPERYPLFLIRAGEQPVTYWVWQRVLDEAELLRVGTHPKFRQQGWGSGSIAEVLQSLRSNQVKRVMLEVRASNTAAINLYTNAGFEQDGRRHNYYPKTDRSLVEDAILMSRSLEDLGGP